MLTIFQQDLLTGHIAKRTKSWFNLGVTVLENCMNRSLSVLGKLALFI